MSKKFVWSQEYSVGVAEIDEQHQEFFNIINNLLAAAEVDSVSTEKLLMEIGLLGDYANYHLGTEEGIFAELNYDGASEHIAIHNLFRVKVKELIDRARAEEVDRQETIKEAANFAGDWLLNHILVVDKQYSKCFNEHGLK